MFSIVVTQLELEMLRPVLFDSKGRYQPEIALIDTESEFPQYKILVFKIEDCTALESLLGWTRNY